MRPIALGPWAGSAPCGVVGRPRVSFALGDLLRVTGGPEEPLGKGAFLDGRNCQSASGRCTERGSTTHATKATHASKAAPCSNITLES